MTLSSLRLAGIPLLFVVAILLLVLVDQGSALPAHPASLPHCKQLRPPAIKGAKILSTVNTVNIDKPFLDPTTGILSPPLNYCEVNVTLTHSGHDKVIVTTWLPLHRDQFNGRYQGTGGGGYLAGKFGTVLSPAVQQGYSAGSTDAGVGFADDGKIFLNNATHQTDHTLLVNFAHRSIHEMTLIGQALTRDYYGKKPKSYFSGCSTGGRQAYMEAQLYPDDYDGILGNAPAIDMTRLAPALGHADHFRARLGYDGPTCELNEVRQRAVDACDELDGAKDGVIAAFELCKFDALTVVGQKFHCNDTGKDMEISRKAALLANEIWTGPVLDDRKVFWGLNHDTNLTVASGQDNTYSLIGDQYIQAFLLHDLDAPVHKIGVRRLDHFIRESVDEYDQVTGTFNPDLSAFEKRGRKLLSWHGTSDLALPPNTTMSYWRSVVEKHGGSVNAVDGFYRLFLAQGVQHCGGGIGPAPSDPLAALVAWVEEGKAPDTLEGVTQDERKEKVGLCRYPRLPRYNKDGKAVCIDTDFEDRFESLAPP